MQTDVRSVVADALAHILGEEKGAEEEEEEEVVDTDRWKSEAATEEGRSESCLFFPSGAAKASARETRSPEAA